jgi:DNA-binding response OmpR family regulator
MAMRRQPAFNVSAGRVMAVTDARTPLARHQATALLPVALVADDDPVLLETLRDALQEGNFRVLSAANGQEALALAQEWVPDLVVTDVGMPRLDGFGFIRAVRRLYPTVPIIVTSADELYANRATATVAAEVGANATLVKPFDLVDLWEAIRAVLP